MLGLNKVIILFAKKGSICYSICRQNEVNVHVDKEKTSKVVVFEVFSIQGGITQWKHNVPSKSTNIMEVCKT